MRVELTHDDRHRWRLEPHHTPLVSDALVDRGKAMSRRHDVLFHFQGHVLQALGDAKVVEERPAAPEGDSSPVPRAEMDDEDYVGEGPIDEHTVESDTLDPRPFQLSPLLLCMPDRVDAVGRSGDWQERGEADVNGPVDHVHRLGVDANRWPLAPCIAIPGGPDEVRVGHEASIHR